MSGTAAAVLLFLAFAILLALCARGFALPVGRAAGAGVRRRHEAAGVIAATGEVPEQWLAEAGRSRWWSRGRESDGIDRRMDRLIRHFEGSPLVVDEPVREFLLRELRAARKRWEEGVRRVGPPQVTTVFCTLPSWPFLFGAPYDLPGRISRTLKPAR